jgi:hypothetical protein
MTSERKKPGVVFWATVSVVVALIAYPLSFGPACWAVRREFIAPYVAAHAYRPILRSSRLLPSGIHRAIVDYAGHDAEGGSTFVWLSLLLRWEEGI